MGASRAGERARDRGRSARGAGNSNLSRNPTACQRLRYSNPSHLRGPLAFSCPSLSPRIYSLSLPPSPPRFTRDLAVRAPPPLPRQKCARRLISFYTRAASASVGIRHKVAAFLSVSLMLPAPHR